MGRALAITIHESSIVDSMELTVILVYAQNCDRLNPSGAAAVFLPSTRLDSYNRKPNEAQRN